MLALRYAALRSGKSSSGVNSKWFPLWYRTRGTYFSLKSRRILSLRRASAFGRSAALWMSILVRRPRSCLEAGKFNDRSWGVFLWRDLWPAFVCTIRASGVVPSNALPHGIEPEIMCQNDTPSDQTSKRSSMIVSWNASGGWYSNDPRGCLMGMLEVSWWARPRSDMMRSSLSVRSRLCGLISQWMILCCDRKRRPRKPSTIHATTERSPKNWLARNTVHSDPYFANWKSIDSATSSKALKFI